MKREKHGLHIVLLYNYGIDHRQIDSIDGEDWHWGYQISRGIKGLNYATDCR